MIFRDRADAGRRLAAALAADRRISGADRVVVLAVPRGGLPVGVEVARELAVPLDVAVARSLRAPHDPEIGFGAVAADGHVEVDEAAVERLGLSEEEVAAEVAHRRDRVARRLALYRSVLPPVDVEGAVAVVVDDGIASGQTARLACGLARRAGASEVVLAVPMAPADVEDALAGVADRTLVLTSPAEYLSVGQAYQDFAHLGDEQALALLSAVSPTGG